MVYIPLAPLDVTVFDGLAPQAGHGLFSKVFIILFLAHLGGVVARQFIKGDVLGRMGVRLPVGRAAHLIPYSIYFELLWVGYWLST
jgi:hypothetical protein